MTPFYEGVIVGIILGVVALLIVLHLTDSFKD